MACNVSLSKYPEYRKNRPQLEAIPEANLICSIICWLKMQWLILKLVDFIDALIPEKKKASSPRNFSSRFVSMIFINLRRLYAMNISPTSALARFIPFFVII